MRVVVTGASGNVGTSVLDRLASEPLVNEVVALARRVPGATWPKTTWQRADVAGDDLVPIFRGADAVVHLAWNIQPSHDPAALFATNVRGSERVLRAVAGAGVPTLVYASSIGAYSRGPKDVPVTEGWPVGGIATSFYSRHKAAVEQSLDRFEEEHAHVRIVRLRKALIFKREAGSGVARLFLGPFVPRAALRPSRIPLVPRSLVVQSVHTDDVAEAYRLALVSDARGAFNIAAAPVLDGATIARALGAKAVPIPFALLRVGASLTWRLRLQPTPPGWVDLAEHAPVMDTSRARSVLGWAETHSSVEALREVLGGIADQAGAATPPLVPGRRPDATTPPEVRR